MNPVMVATVPGGPLVGESSSQGPAGVADGAATGTAVGAAVAVAVGVERYGVGEGGMRE
jgi:hypothetical protein